MSKLVFVFIMAAFSAIILNSFEIQKHVGDRSLYQSQDTGRVYARVIQSIPMGNKTVLILNKGTAQKVKKGDKGMIPGLDSLKFTITEVYQFRSKAIADTIVEKANLEVLIFLSGN